MTHAGTPAPLKGTRVVEFGTGYVAPVASMYLGLLGAEIVKIENRKSPDFMRGDVRKGHGLTASFVDANRGKRSVAVDAKTDKGRMLVEGLLRRTDVLVENFGGGAMKRLGFSYQAVCAIKSDIVMASLQGLGADVEHSTTLGQNIPPLIGLTHLWNHPGAERPVGSQLFHPDYYAGVFSAALIVAALDHRRRTGAGHFIDAAQAEVAASLLGPWYLACAVNKDMPQPVGNKGTRGVPAGCYPCRGDDEWCVIVVHNDDEWLALKRAVGMADWVRQASFDTMLGRLRNRQQLDAALGAWTRTQAAREVMEKLQRHGVSCGVVQSVAGMAADRQLTHQGFIQPLQQPEFGCLQVGGLPLAWGEAGIDANRRCPAIGEHTASILNEWLGLRPDEIKQLEAERIIEVGATARPSSN